MDIAQSLEERAKVHWFAMRAYKCENRVEEELRKVSDLGYFIPKHYEIRTYHGVKSRRLVPVIPNLIFVHASHIQIIKFKERCNYLQFMMWEKSTGKEYITIPDNQMDNFIKVASLQVEDTIYYKPEEINLRKGIHVCIHGGELDGVHGFFMRVKGKRNRRLVVLLEGLMAITAEVHPDLIEVLD